VASLCGFRRSGKSHLSALYRHVLSRLQYGCSMFVGCVDSLRHLLPQLDRIAGGGKLALALHVKDLHALNVIVVLSTTTTASPLFYICFFRDRAGLLSCQCA
jgi:hypothetical protein